MANEYRLTTPDNEYDPFTQFKQWYMRDVELGHNTCSKLARLTNNTGDLTDEEEQADTERAMDRMVELFFLDHYIKVQRKEKVS